MTKVTLVVTLCCGYTSRRQISLREKNERKACKRKAQNKEIDSAAGSESLLNSACLRCT